MDTMKFEQDTTVFFIQAVSFPDGVLAAHQQLHRITPKVDSRKCFGVSRPEDHVISYKAAAEQISDGESSSLGLKTLVLKKGDYYCVTIHDFMKNLPAIGETFQQILQQPGIDPEGYCVEWYYTDNDVHCMVRKAGN